jgi:hypothetical protein
MTTRRIDTIQLKYFTLLRDLMYNLRLCEMLMLDTSLCANLQLRNDKEKISRLQNFLFI